MKQFLILSSDLNQKKNKDKWECYLRGMANTLYTYAVLNKIEDITWDICYEIARDTIYHMNWYYINVYNYLENVEFLNEFQPQYKHDMFSILTDKNFVEKYKDRIEKKRKDAQE